MDGHHYILANTIHQVPESLQYFIGTTSLKPPSIKSKTTNLFKSTLHEFSNSFYTLVGCLLGKEWLAKFKIWYKHLHYKNGRVALPQVGISQLQLHYQTM